MSNIWNHKIQELILSGQEESILLGISLVEDKKELGYWSAASISTCSAFNLRPLPAPVKKTINEMKYNFSKGRGIVAYCLYVKFKEAHEHLE